MIKTRVTCLYEIIFESTYRVIHLEGIEKGKENKEKGWEREREDKRTLGKVKEREEKGRERGGNFREKRKK